MKGNIAIIKHTDNGETQIETPESGAEFAVYLKAAGSATRLPRTPSVIISPVMKTALPRPRILPYGIYTVHQVSGWEGSETDARL